MIRVLHVITTLGRGGIEHWLVSMLDQIRRTDCAMDFCCKGDSVGVLARVARDSGAKVYLCPLKVTQVGFIADLRRLVVSQRYDIVHNHLEAYSGLPVYACRTLGVPVITSFHNTEFPAQTWLGRPVFRQLRDTYLKLSVKYALRYSTGATGCSQGVVDAVRLRYGGDNWRVLYYGIDLPSLACWQERREFRETFGWSEHTPILVHVGRFAEQKNHFGLLRVFELVLRRFPSAKLLLIGDGPLRAAAEASVKSRQLSPAVRFLGSRDDVPAVVSRCDVFLFPSWFEGFGLAALEANAAGIPVVASNVAGSSEAIENGVTGFLGDPRDSNDMAIAVAKLLADPVLATRLGAAGRARARERFSKRASADCLLDCYDQSLHRHQVRFVPTPEPQFRSP
jgi:glycosyltransferase EpsF